MSAAERPVSVAVDAMGGDFFPEVNVKGALAALSASESLHVTLVGDRSVILSELKKQKAEVSSRLQIVHAEETISMEEGASQAFRKKKKSSIHVGLELVKDSTVNAFISAGHSGAMMACASMILGRLPGVERPAIVVKLPTAEGFVIVLDAGANVDCRAEHLGQFAEMGRVYAEVIEGFEKPRIGLLSNATEHHKGNELTRETDTLLRTFKRMNYIGYVEGFDLFQGKAEVVVCDGFVGNIILKGVEGLAATSFKWFKRELKMSLRGMLGVLLLRPILESFRGRFDYQPYGAAPLLGINGMVLISHGSSTELAIKNGILTAERGVEQDFIAKVGAYLADSEGQTEA